MTFLWSKAELMSRFSVAVLCFAETETELNRFVDAVAAKSNIGDACTATLKLKTL